VYVKAHRAIGAQEAYLRIIIGLALAWIPENFAQEEHIAYASVLYIQRIRAVQAFHYSANLPLIVRNSYRHVLPLRLTNSVDVNFKE